MQPRPHAPDSGHHEVASDGGGEQWGILASLIETSKLNSVDPQAYLADGLTRLVDGHPMSRIDDLLPWAYAKPTIAAAA